MIKKLLLSSFLFFSLLSVQAQTIDGADLYYDLLTPKTYRVTAVIYRACNSAPLDSILGYVLADSLKVPVKFIRSNIKKLSDTCGNPCQIVNQYSNPGIERHTYSALIDFNSSSFKVFVDSGKCTVYFAIHQSGRDNVVSNQSSGLFYLDASTNICDTAISKNASPRFSIDPKFSAACNFPIFYSPGPSDSLDYDSLAFSLEPVQVNFASPVNYKNNYSYLIPFTPYCPPNPGVTNCKALPNASPPRGFYFDPQLCQIAFTPIVCSEVAYIRYKVKEFRRVNGQMHFLGYSSREMKMSINSSPDNNPPTFTGVFNMQSAPVFACDKPNILEIKTSDVTSIPNQQIVDSTYIFYDRAYSKTDITVYDTVREKSADIKIWNDKNLVGRTQYFTVAVKDRLCNLSLSSKTFSYTSLPEVQYKKTVKLDSCNNFSFQIDSLKSGQNLTGKAFISDEDGKPLGQLNEGSSFKFNRNGQYLVEYQIYQAGFSCFKTAYDTVKITNALSEKAYQLSGDTSVCASFQAQLKIFPSKIANFNSVEWYKNDTLINTGDSTINSVIYNTSQFKIKITDKNLCTQVLERQYTRLLVPANLLFNSYNGTCPGDSILITANGNTLKKPIQFTWTYKNQSRTSTDDYFKFKTASGGKLHVFAQDDNLCVSRDSADINLFSTIQFNLNAGTQSGCEDSTFTVKLENLSAQATQVLWYQDDSLISGGTALSFQTVLKGSTEVKAVLTNQLNCVSMDSALLQAIPNPQVNFMTGQNFCGGDSTRMAIRFSPFIGIKTYTWLVNGVKVNHNDSVFWYKGPQNALIEGKVSNGGLCFDGALRTITMYPKARKLRILTDTFYHPLNQINLDADSVYSFYNWFNGAQTKTNSFLASDLGAPGTYLIRLDVADANGCRSADSLHIYTDRRLNLNKTEIDKIRVYPNPVQDVLYVHVETALHYEIYNPAAQLVLSGDVESGMSTINFENLSSGLYVLRIGNQTLHIMKE